MRAPPSRRARRRAPRRDRRRVAGSSRGGGARIGPARGCVVGAGATVERLILAEGVAVEAGDGARGAVARTESPSDEPARRRAAPCPTTFATPSGASIARLEAAPSAGLLVCGMGGSAIGGDLAAAASATRLARPLVTVRGYRLPPGPAPTGPCSARATPGRPRRRRLLRRRRRLGAAAHRRRNRRAPRRPGSRGRASRSSACPDPAAADRGRLHGRRRRRGRRRGRGAAPHRGRGRGRRRPARVARATCGARGEDRRAPGRARCPCSTAAS